MIYNIGVIEEEIGGTSSLKELQQLKNKYINDINQYIKNLDKMDKDSLININKEKKQIIEIFQGFINKYDDKEKVIDLQDKYLPSYKFQGKIHIITQLMEEIRKIMNNFGFTYENGVEIDTAENIFDKLNIDEFHACRNEQQSFFFLNSHLQPRTQTSNVQTKILTNWNNKDILKKYTIGKVYRYDSDRTHVPMFHQMEVMYINDDANISTLSGFIDIFLEKIFKKKIEYRMRISYFPFTTPSYEVDVKLKDKWLELLGCGIIHEDVFKKNNKTFTYGFALGLGIERLCMLLEQCEDMRDLYSNKNVF